MHAEWTRIEPEQGQIDEKALARYHAILDCLLRCLFWLAAQLQSMMAGQCHVAPTPMQLAGSLRELAPLIVGSLVGSSMLGAALECCTEVQESKLSTAPLETWS